MARTKKMIVYINGRFLEDKLTGVGRFCMNIIDEFDRLDDPSINFVLLITRKCKLTINYEQIIVKRVGFFTGNLWEQVELPWYSRNGILLSLAARGPIVKANQVLTIHDAATKRTPERFSFRYRALLWFTYYMLKNRAIITTVSNFSKKELIKYYNIPKENIYITVNGTNHFRGYIDGKKVLDRYELFGKKYIVSVGGTKNKNIDRVIKAYEKLSDDIYLVIIGNVNKEALMYDNGNIIFTGYVTDEELVALYRNAKCLVFPSLYEGFGIPPLEAMSLSCPSVVSNTTSLPEVCGEAVLYCDPYDIDDIYEKVKLLLDDDEKRIELIKKGKEQLKKYTWSGSAKKFHEIINKFRG